MAASDSSYYPGNVKSQFEHAGVQAPGVSDASVAHTVRSDTVANTAADAKAGLDALGTKINLLIDALERAGISVTV